MRKFLVALATLVVGLGAVAVPAGAGEMPVDLEFTVTPTSGEAGTSVTFDSVDACPVPNQPEGQATNAYGDVVAAIAMVDEPSTSEFIADTLVDGNGDWSIPYTIDGSAPLGDQTFWAFCLYDVGTPPIDLTAASIPQEFIVLASYAPVTFTVTAPPTTTTTTTTPSTTTTTTIPAPTLTASPTTVYPGDTIQVQASGFAPNSNVVITLESDPVNLGTYVADSAGRIATSVTVPSNFPTGQHTLKLTGVDIASNVLVLTTGITVASRVVVTTVASTVVAVTATTGTLPQTGSSITTPAVVAAGTLILAGGAAVVVARRRRAASR